MLIPKASSSGDIDGSGNIVCVPNGRYDPATGTVTFSTTHFSLYAVGYNPASFSDVAPTDWYYKAVSFIAARGITTGAGNGAFSPDAGLTRADFLVMLMKAYGIAPDNNPADNFSDAAAPTIPAIWQQPRPGESPMVWATISLPRKGHHPTGNVHVAVTHSRR